MMSTPAQIDLVQSAEEESLDHRWYWKSLSAAKQASSFLRFVSSTMRSSGYPKQDIFGLRLALHEAITNAIEHGHRGDLAKTVRIRFHLNSHYAMAVVEDEGQGFDLEAEQELPAAQTAEPSKKRGLMLIRAHTTWIRHNERGNCVTLCKIRSRQ